jgi:hypothetical protein
MEKIIFFIYQFLLDPKFSLVEINYKIHDKEFLTIMDVFEEWHHLFEGVRHETIAYLDHRNLQYFLTTRVLNQCQAQWALSLSQFRFVITYHFGHQQGKLDTLSYCSYFAPKEKDVVYEQQCDVIFKLELLNPKPFEHY